MKQIHLISLILLIISCGHDMDKKKYENNTHKEQKASYHLFKPVEYISKFDTLSLSYKDSLIRIVRVDSTSISIFKHNLKTDSVDLTHVVKGGIFLPINDSINYALLYGLKKDYNKTFNPQYDIKFQNKYTKLDTNAKIKFVLVDNINLNNQILKFTKNFSSGLNDTMVSINEFN